MTKGTLCWLWQRHARMTMRNIQLHYITFSIKSLVYVAILVHNKPPSSKEKATKRKRERERERESTIQSASRKMPRGIAQGSLQS